jgi:hypothetical protein
MTENYLPASTPPQQAESPPPVLAEEQGTAEVVKDQAADLSHSGIQAGKHAADVAREQASGVAAEAGSQGKDLLRQAQDQLAEQAARGQQQLAAELLSLSDELSSMADGSSQGGVAADLARHAASRARDAGQWLGDRRPAQVMDEVQSFARRRPGVFVALAAAAGLAAGRLTRGVKSAAADDPAPAAPDAMRELSGRWPQPPAEAAYQAGTVGITDDVPAPAGGLRATGGVTARDTSTTFGDQAVLAGGQADSGDLP